jgi:hypothetical protein
VAEQGGSDVDGQAVVDEFGGEDSPEVVVRSRRAWPVLTDLANQVA